MAKITERWEIHGPRRTEGAGGFLNPPGHPEHVYSVHGYRGRSREASSITSLSAAVACEWVSDEARAEAKALLDAWTEANRGTTPPVAWVRSVLGYFRHMYRWRDRADPKAWHVSELLADSKRDPVENADDHAGVNLIRRFYPEFTPTADDFAQARWGSGD